jgi:hypothetical protein
MEARAAAGTSLLPLAPWSVHDLRRTVATGLRRLDVRFEVRGGAQRRVRAERRNILAPPKLPGMSSHVETHAVRLARYQRQARECRDRAAHACDVGNRLDLISIAQAYELLEKIEAADQAFVDSGLKK